MAESPGQHFGRITLAVVIKPDARRGPSMQGAHKWERPWISVGRRGPRVAMSNKQQGAHARWDVPPGANHSLAKPRTAGNAGHHRPLQGATCESEEGATTTPHCNLASHHGWASGAKRDPDALAPPLPPEPRPVPRPLPLLGSPEGPGPCAPPGRLTPPNWMLGAGAGIGTSSLTAASQSA